MSQASRTSLPRLRAYVAGLPAGLASHPGCLARGAVVRATFEDAQHVVERADELPPELGPLLRDPPLASEWVPEAHFVALFHAVNDLLGLDDEAVLARTRAVNRALFDSPAYRILMAVFSPATLLRFAGKRWDNFHRGSTLLVEGAADDGVSLVLAFPERLFDSGVLWAFGQAFVAALELSGARSADVKVVDVGTAGCRYRAIWG